MEGVLLYGFFFLLDGSIYIYMLLIVFSKPLLDSHFFYREVERDIFFPYKKKVESEFGIQLPSVHCVKSRAMTNIRDTNHLAVRILALPFFNLHWQQTGPSDSTNGHGKFKTLIAPLV
jgi:hypothetical protein